MKLLVITLLLLASGISFRTQSASAPDRTSINHGLANDSRAHNSALSTTLRLAVEVDPRTLDPAQMVSNEEAMLAGLCFHTLFDPGPGGTVRPSLAESLPEVSADGLTVTVPLRQGVRFANGRELDAQDVVWTFERMFDPRLAAFCAVYFKSLSGSTAYTEARTRETSATGSSPRAEGESNRSIEPRSLAGIQALGRHTVRFRLERRDPCFLNYLAMPVAAIVPRDESPMEENRLARRPLGTGPFVLESWKRGARLRFRRNPFHPSDSRERPTAVDVLVGIDRTTQTMLFERGELDFQHYISDSDFHRIRRHPERRTWLKAAAGTTPAFIFLNCEIPPFTNRQVRIAVSHAIDKAAIARSMGKRSVQARGPLPLSVTGFNQDLPAYDFDPPRARALLAEAGLADGFESVLWTNRDDPRWVKIALLAQQYLREVGVRIDIREVGYPTLVESAGRRGQIAMGVFDCLAGIDDPQEIFDLMLNGENITAEACINTAFYSNAQVNHLFRISKDEADPSRRRDVLRKAERLIVEDAPWIFLVQFNTETLAQPWLKGYEPRGFWPPVSLRDCTIVR